MRFDSSFEEQYRQVTPATGTLESLVRTETILKGDSVRLKSESVVMEIKSGYYGGRET
jgi:hypothetical protein